MGQYYEICNVDKKEYLHPHDFGAGLKLMEFAFHHPSEILAGLAILLADGNGRGGGDCRSDSPIIGRWKYDRIVVLGDYADENDLANYEDVTEEEDWLNVGISVWLALSDSEGGWYRKYFLDNYKAYGFFPHIITALAHAHKSKQYGTDDYPILSKCAERFFTNLYLEKGTNYYKVINGIAKHHSTNKAGLEYLERNQKKLINRIQHGEDMPEEESTENETEQILKRLEHIEKLLAI